MRLFAILLCVAGLSVACGSSDDNQGNANRDTLSPLDSEYSDVAFVDTQGKDTAAPDTAALDTAAPDTATPDTALPDTAPPDVLADLPPGTLSCKQFYQQCLAACPAGADGQPTAACFDQCRTQLSAEGETVTAALIVCVEDSGCKDLTDAGQSLTCFSTTCSQPYFACFHGDDKCSAVLTCMGGCPKGDTYNACVVTCTQDGTQDAQKQLITILQCIGDACCPNDAAACGTAQGQACSSDAVKMGGACFGQVTACVLN